MTRARTGVPRTVVAVLALLLAPLVVVAESWHTCTLPAGIGAGGARVATPPGAHPASVHPCLACSLARQPRLGAPPPAVPAANPGAESLLPVSAGPRPFALSALRPPGRAPPA